jgi:hypothetical protein
MVLAAAASLSACGPMGQVDQGIVVAYDAAAGEVTLVLDSNPNEPGNPRYDRLPPVKVRVPADPSRMGPQPEAGGLIAVDIPGGRATVFDPSSGNVQSVPFEIVERAEGVAAGDSRVVRGAVPRVDPAAGTVTLYSPRTRQLLTIRVPGEFAGLPPASWRAGDEVRYYFKDPAQALRMMNVSRTKLS